MTSITFLVLFAILLKVNTALDEGDSCTLIDGNSGVCLNLKKCPVAITNIRRRKNPKICSYADDYRTPIVCCANPVASPVLPNEERVSAQKCKEYTNLVVEKNYLSSGQVLESSKCKPNVHLIVGGTKAEYGEFPHMAAIGWTNGDNLEFNCAGSIISERWILSAAHCNYFEGVSPDVARLGSQSLSYPDTGSEDFEIIEILTPPHPQKYAGNMRYNDILLFRVDRDIRFHQNMRPACLWQDNYIREETAVASGWGKTTFDSVISDDLMKVSLEILDNSICNDTYISRKIRGKTPTGDRKSTRGVINSQLCAGDLAGGKDACQGDSGGSLQITDSKYSCVYYLIGITSFGLGCGVENSPGVYTRVSSYIDWIEKIVWT